MSFANFDGKAQHNVRPKYRRAELLENGIREPHELDDSIMRNAAGEIDPELVAAESYVLSGFVIEQMWHDMKIRPYFLSKADSPRIPLGKNFWSDFGKHYEEIDWAATRRFNLGIMDLLDKLNRVKTGESWNLTFDEKMLLRWHYIKSLLVGKEWSGSPSTKDFIGIYTRLARAATERFVTQLGKEPSRAEYEHILKDPSFQGMMTQMMMNSRSALDVVLIELENREKPALGMGWDASHAFNPDCFEIIEKPDGPILQPDKKLFDDLRSNAAEYVAHIKEIRQESGKALRCPVVYTPIFTEMCDWMRHEFSHHYLDQKYSIQDQS